jgi:hypothetical protein
MRNPTAVVFWIAAMTCGVVRSDANERTPGRKPEDLRPGPVGQQPWSKALLLVHRFLHPSS